MTILVVNIDITKIKENLIDIGLDEKEVLIYSLLLQTDHPNATSLSRQSGIKRTTVNYYIQRLHKRGFLKFVQKGKGKKIEIESPSIIFKFLLKEEKERHESINNSLKFLTDHVANTINDSKYFSVISKYSGVDGVKLFMEKVLNSKKEVYWFGSIETLFKVRSPEEVLKYFTRERIQKKLPIYAITDRSLLKYPEFSNSINTQRYIRFIDDEIKESCILIIFEDNFAIMSVPYKYQVSVSVIEDPLVSKTLSIFYKALWNYLSK